MGTENVKEDAALDQTTDASSAIADALSAAVASTTAPAVQEEVKPAPVVEVKPVEEVKDVINEASVIDPELGQMDLVVLSGFDGYIAAMSPTVPVTEDTGIIHQHNLYRTLKLMFDYEDITFNKVFPAVLKKIADNSNPGAFDEYHLFRFFDQVRMSETDQKAFTSLLSFLKVASKIAGRNGKLLLKQVNLQSATQFGIGELGRKRIFTYYNLNS